MSMILLDYTPMPELIAPLQAAYKRLTAASDEWIEATLAYAQLLVTARQAQPSNQAFNQWLVANDLDDVSKDDRAALLNIAAHPDLFRDVALSERRSWQHVWRDEMQPRLRHVTKTDLDPAAPPESTLVAEEIASPTPVEVAKSDPISAATLVRSPLRHLPDYELVLQHVQQSSTRTMLAALQKKPRVGRLLWDLLVESIRSGAYGPPSTASVSRPNLRLLLPWAPPGYAQRFDLLSREDLRIVREQILPVVLAQRDRLHREPDQLQQLLADDTRSKREAAEQAAQTQRAHAQATQYAAAKAALPTTEKPIVLYGEPFWPPPRGAGSVRWTYVELLEAAWFFRAMVPLFESANLGALKRGHVAQGTMQCINLLLKFLPWRTTPFAEAVRQIGLAYEKAPDVESQVPTCPPNYGLTA
jgi:hypothetical protein